MNTESLLQQLVSFESEIQQCMNLFSVKFGVKNPLRLWREGTIPRIGLIGDSGCEYTLHGFGCTVERGCKDVSFDFDGPDSFVYSPSKFYAFLGSEDLDVAVVHAFFGKLNSNGYLKVVTGRGVRLSSEVVEQKGQVS